ncbi:hypothetical protein K488DRAFT_85461 [Vararia minispora EC-137]|uniref:Uncharacterized protein n=1 Tax=Vararia minispora EC-137 TaxID=1314806 RepID=A0ACB8QMI8_9AGAM|nr:hypothetical protein K488DRAFT_85461 [Vararia minispora EC-137]
MPSQLPFPVPGSSSKGTGRWYAYDFFLLVLVIFPSCFWFVYHVGPNSKQEYPNLGVTLPPNYYEWHERENAMPQNNLNLPPPQGRRGRYVRFNNFYGNVGWGNAQQEMIMNAHIAYKSERIFTMYNYTWKKETREDYWTYERGDKKDVVPSRIPLTALLDGPIAGGPFPVSDWRPPAVTTEFFEEVCPHPTYLNVGETKGDLQWASAATIMNGIIEKLNSIDDRCVEFVDGTGQLFDFWIFGDGPRMADIWPQLMESPILTDWAWSDLVKSGVEHNCDLIHPFIRPNDLHRSELRGLLALHVRRGDFETHCAMLSNWCSLPNAFNTRHDFPDKHNPPVDRTCDGNHHEATHEYYFQHCFPTIEQIVARVEVITADAARQGRKLDRIYILTNGSKDWLGELKIALSQVRPWLSITTSRDLDITWEQKFVAQAMDQLIATRAEVFVGNSWSSLSSNINLIRAALMRDPETCRLL